MENGKSKRGFASMSPERQREIASRGGKAAHAKGTAHEFTPEEARGAGRKGGMIVSRNKEHMASIGREGGHMRAKKAQLHLVKDLNTTQNSTVSQPETDTAAESNLPEKESRFG